MVNEPSNREILEVLVEFKQNTEQKFIGIDKRFDHLEEFVGEMKTEMEERFIKVEERFTKVDEHFTDVYHKLDDMRNDTRRISDKVDIANERLYRIEKSRDEDIIALGEDVRELKHKYRKLQPLNID